MDPESISFITANEGWALGPGTCTNCARIWHTTDAGQHWTTMTSTLALPGDDESAAQGGAVTIDFLNNLDGYLFFRSRCSTDCALITTNGGQTWRTSPIPEPGVVADGSRSLYAITADTQPTELLRTTIGSNDWTRITLPRIHTNQFQGFAIAAEGDTLAVLQVGADLEAPLKDAGDLHAQVAAGALWISHSQGAQYSRVTDPCHDTDGGAASISISLSHTDSLLLDCYDGEQSSQEAQTQNHLYRSRDEGQTWIRLPDPATSGGPGSIVDNGDGHVLYLNLGGFGYQLRVSLDNATHWRTVLHDGSGGFGLDGPDFVNTQTAFALGPINDPPEHLYRTTDAGRTWHQLPPPTP